MWYRIIMYFIMGNSFLASPCTQSGCERCDAAGCCQTCSSGYTISVDNCSCGKEE